MHVHSNITHAVAAMDSCFALIGAHEHGIAARLLYGQSCLQNPFNGEASAKHSFKHQLNTTHMGADLAAPHSSSPMACVLGSVDQELPWFACQ